MSDTAAHDGAEREPGSAPAPKRGQRSFTWDEPGEWVHDPVKKLKHCRVELGGGATNILLVKYEPGAEVAPHHHHADYCSIIVEGSIEITRRAHGAGDMRVVNAGTAYGPLLAGPEGCTVIEIFATGVPDPALTMANTYL